MSGSCGQWPDDGEWTLGVWLEKTAMSDPKVRRDAVVALEMDDTPQGQALLSHPKVAARLLQLLHDTESNVVWSCVRCFEAASAPGAAAQILRLVDEGVVPQEVAAPALCHQGGEGLRAVLDWLERDAELDEEHRCSLARALGHAVSDRVLPVLLMLAEDPAWQVRWGVAQAMEKLACPEAIDVVAGLVRDETVPPEENYDLPDWLARLKEEFGR